MFLSSKQDFNKKGLLFHDSVSGQASPAQVNAQQSKCTI